MKTYLVGKGMVALLGSCMYCQSTFILLHKTADRSSIYWSQCIMNFKITSIYEVLGEEKTSYVESVSNPGRTPKRILWVLPTYISLGSTRFAGTS